MKRHHPYSAMFPMMTGKELRKLADDIAANGLLTPIMLDADGQIIDGRNRERACELAGITPRYKVFEGSDEEILKYILSNNLHRRHLTPSQRASAAAKFMQVCAEQAKARQKAAGGKKKGRQKALPENFPEAEKGDARDLAGRALQVSGKLVDMAVKVHEHAIPEIVTAVDAGNLAVSAAVNVASLPRDQQQSIMDNGGVPAVRKAAAVVRRSRGKIVVHDGSGVSETPPHPPSIPLVLPAIASDATSTKETISALVKLAKGAPHSYRMEVIESLLETLPEDNVLRVRRRCDDVLSDRRRHTETASG